MSLYHTAHVPQWAGLHTLKRTDSTGLHRKATRAFFALQAGGMKRSRSAQLPQQAVAGPALAQAAGFVDPARGQSSPLPSLLVAAPTFTEQMGSVMGRCVYRMPMPYRANAALWSRHFSSSTLCYFRRFAACRVEAEAAPPQQPTSPEASHHLAPAPVPHQWAVSHGPPALQLPPPQQQQQPLNRPPQQQPPTQPQTPLTPTHPPQPASMLSSQHPPLAPMPSPQQQPPPPLPGTNDFLQQLVQAFVQAIKQTQVCLLLYLLGRHSLA